MCREIEAAAASLVLDCAAERVAGAILGAYPIASAGLCDGKRGKVEPSFGSARGETERESSNV